MPGINSGDVLLSHKLYKHYHRGCSVSLPCSEWERVGPLRYDHQRSEAGPAVSMLRIEFVPASASLVTHASLFSLKNQAADSLISTYRDSVRNFQGFVLIQKSFPSICRRTRFAPGAAG